MLDITNALIGDILDERLEFVNADDVNVLSKLAERATSMISDVVEDYEEIDIFAAMDVDDEID